MIHLQVKIFYLDCGTARPSVAASMTVSITTTAGKYDRLTIESKVIAWHLGGISHCKAVVPNAHLQVRAFAHADSL